jgi:hypothetical protein
MKELWQWLKCILKNPALASPLMKREAMTREREAIESGKGSSLRNIHLNRCPFHDMWEKFVKI